MGWVDYLQVRVLEVPKTVGGLSGLLNIKSLYAKITVRSDKEALTTASVRRQRGRVNVPAWTEPLVILVRRRILGTL